MFPAVWMVSPMPGMSGSGLTERSWLIRASSLFDAKRMRARSALAPTAKTLPRPKSLPSLEACAEPPQASESVRVRSRLP
jgi:hypothetical protein